MDLNEYDICCPTDEKLHKQWVAKLNHEKNALTKKISSQETVLKILGSPIRLAILHYISVRPHCVCEIVQKLALPHSNVSYHISQLVFANILHNINNNGRVYYTITELGENIIKWLEKIPKEEELIKNV